MACRNKHNNKPCVYTRHVNTRTCGQWESSVNTQPCVLITKEKTFKPNTEPKPAWESPDPKKTHSAHTTQHLMQMRACTARANSELHTRTKTRRYTSVTETRINWTQVTEPWQIDIWFHFSGFFILWFNTNVLSKTVVIKWIHKTWPI